MTDQEIEALKFKIESNKLIITERDMHIARLKNQLQDQDKIIAGYAKFIRDNLHNIKRNNE